MVFVVSLLSRNTCHRFFGGSFCNNLYEDVVSQVGLATILYQPHFRIDRETKFLVTPSVVEMGYDSLDGSWRPAYKVDSVFIRGVHFDLRVDWHCAWKRKGLSGEANTDGSGVFYKHYGDGGGRGAAERSGASGYGGVGYGGELHYSVRSLFSNYTMVECPLPDVDAHPWLMQVNGSFVLQVGECPLPDVDAHPWLMQVNGPDVDAHPWLMQVNGSFVLQVGPTSTHTLGSCRSTAASCCR